MPDAEPYVIGCVCWLLYRYVFFGALSMTPGGHVAAALVDRVLVWMYNREQARLSAE